MNTTLFADIGATRTARRSSDGAPTVPAAAEFALLHGDVMHRRRRPAANAFNYPAFSLRLPLSRLAELPTRGIAHNARGAVSFHDRDHGARDGSPLEAWIRALLAAEGIEADGEIVLHAFPRMLGYVFNPVSFWVCHDVNGAVRAVLCEVCNTFGECHNYLLAHPDGRALTSGETLPACKVFHVSPFCDVKGRYAFRFHFGADRWLARIDYFDDDGPLPLLETSVSGRAAPVEPAAVRSLVWRYRLFTFGVVARIHWQALRLFVKRVPFFAKPAPPPQRTTR
ncbi:MAG: DUF1365 domain-containing protein [Aromatoleum sp.]|nr:DUF1365 domain-containing protein [Aromatoleum sp.]